MSEMIMYEGPRSIMLAGFASISPDVREIAWAEKHVSHDPDLKWILGNFVQSEVANDNGHIFPLEDLKVTHGTIANKPMNMLHKETNVVGHFGGSQLMFPMEGAAADERVTSPYVEVVGAFYKYYFSDDYELVERAYKDGMLGLSMECVPQKLRCAAEGCGSEHEYAGRASATYCAHLQEPGANRHLIQPHFKGGALIVPPAVPAWSRADVRELSTALAWAEKLREDVQASSSDLDATTWNKIMSAIITQAEEFRS